MSVTVDLWRWRLDDADPRALSADEHARAASFVFARDRDRYIAGRARLRGILGQYLGRAPGDIVFDYGPYGRPYTDGIGFNLAHTGDAALLAVAIGPALGVDIEALCPIPLEVAETHFSQPEVAALNALPQAQQLDGFYRCWTRKEAYLKAKGTGISTDLASFAVTLEPDEPPRLLSCASGDAAAWSLHHLAPAPGLIGALAIRSVGQAVTLNWRS